VRGVGRRPRSKARSHGHRALGAARFEPLPLLPSSLSCTRPATPWSRPRRGSGSRCRSRAASRVTSNSRPCRVSGCPLSHLVTEKPVKRHCGCGRRGGECPDSDCRCQCRQYQHLELVHRPPLSPEPLHEALWGKDSEPTRLFPHRPLAAMPRTGDVNAPSSGEDGRGEGRGGASRVAAMRRLSRRRPVGSSRPPPDPW
jgi:hypothetical protein